ncbi:MAG TPA: OmpA family protein [Xanthomonadaceae bacterium]|jgi:OOP family OmpA-OmpF porin|nr:OmpA family protein [Xanthomonadaceae bacterium]
MNKKILCLALFSAMGAAQAVMAQDFDDRWYIDGTAGYNFQDKSRSTENAPFGGIGVGKPISPDWSLELNWNYQNPKETNNIPSFSGHWQQYDLELDALYHFHVDDKWNPYVRFGLGWQHTEEDYSLFSNIYVPETRKSDNLAAAFGVGLERNYGRYSFRTEFGARYDGNDRSINSPNSNYFVDLLASIGVTVALGPPPMKAVEPAPAPAPVVTCADKDSDGDGVNDCNDKCPNTPAGTTVGPDGCPVPVTIDLRGVNFDFDKSKLRPDAVEILGQAIEVLKKYPELKVEVAGHTDSIGTDAYNQKLSERRAKAVYDYLTSNGVDAGRLIGPHGYGKTRPIAPNTNPDGTDNPQGRAQNRRTELNVQN